jgi:hypothetical protein
MRYHYSEQVKENEMDEADIMNGGDRIAYQILFRKTWRKAATWETLT